MFHPFNIKHPSDYWRSPLRRAPLPGIEPEADFAVSEESRTGDNLPLLSVLEAVLFLSREPLPLKRLAQLSGIPGVANTKKLLHQLAERYEAEQAAVTLVEVAEGFQLRTRPEFAPYLVRMQEIPTTVKLSPPAMETLTIIAYKQPVTRTDVEAVRGVACGDIIRQLLEQNLVKIAGHSNELGRPFLYGTTKKFLQVFGLKGLDTLPELE
ncbi:hypothetical protein FACS189419_08050 [Planctomycetales bacterium]|nr:hypothetical protein FACS189419_08050 [Planctomycetales bacterium]